MLTRTFRFTFPLTGDRYSVRLESDGTRSPATAPFHFELDPASRLNQVVEAIAEASVTFDDVREVGAILFTSLLNGDVREHFLAERQESERAAGEFRSSSSSASTSRAI